jgi:hypothetical protein
MLASTLTAAALTASLLAAAPAAAAPDETPPATTTTATPSRDQQDRQFAADRPNRSSAQRTVLYSAARIPGSIRGWAACVLDRESGGSLNDWSSGAGARNPASSASGRWQFLDGSWRRGLSFMVRDRLVEFGMPRAQARQVREYLAARPISEWEGVYQDVGFVEVVSRGGRFHWNGGSHSC